MHKKFLLAALQQAWLGRGICAPNPAVGAIAVQNGTIIAQASHRGSGTAHAERLLCQQFAPNTPQVTLYVTLEPCNHWGKTPPCVDMLIQHGIERVVFAYRDPNPIVTANNSPQLLTNAGIEVIHYPLAEIDAFYQSYRHWVLTQKPWVTVKIAQSFDGKIARADGGRVYLSNEPCAIFTHQQRMHTDVILTTAQTVLADNPQLNARLGGSIVPKAIAILNRTGHLDQQSQVLQSAKHCYMFHDDRQTIEPRYAPHISYYPTPLERGYLNLAVVMQTLGQLGYHDVFVEAGGRLFSALHQQRLVNQTYIYITPHILGEDALAMTQDIDLFRRPHQLTWIKQGNNIIASVLWQEDLCLQAL